MKINPVKNGMIALAVAGSLMLGIPVMARQGGAGYGKHYGPHPSFGPHFHHGKPFMHLDRMQYQLGLTDEQVEKIFRIGQNYRENLFKNRNNYEAVRDLREKKRKDIENVLNNEQKKRFNEFCQFRNERFKKSGKRTGSGGY